MGKLCLLKKISRKKVCRPTWTSYIVALCSLCAFFFFVGFISRLHCVGLLWDHDAYVAAEAIAIRPKPCPTTRVLSTVETWAVTELVYTTPSLLVWGVMGPKRTRRWNRGVRPTAWSPVFLEMTCPCGPGSKKDFSNNWLNSTHSVRPQSFWKRPKSWSYKNVWATKRLLLNITTI
jgi:hypothetical protein